MLHQHNQLIEAKELENFLLKPARCRADTAHVSWLNAAGVTLIQWDMLHNNPVVTLTL